MMATVRVGCRLLESDVAWVVSMREIGGEDLYCTIGGENFEQYTQL